MKNSSAIEVIEQDQSESVICPFCGFVACPGMDDQDWEFDAKTCVCEHTLFVANDHGFSYRSIAFNAHMGLPQTQDSESGLTSSEAANIDAFTSKVRMPGAVKFVAYLPAPSFFGIYFGFAPSA